MSRRQQIIHHVDGFNDFNKSMDDWLKLPLLKDLKRYYHLYAIHGDGDYTLVNNLLDSLPLDWQNDIAPYAKKPVYWEKLNSRVWLYYILKHYEQNSEKLKLATTELKPSLTDSSIEFNISHTGHDLFIGISWQQPIGVDVERIRPIDSLAIAKRYFSKEEIEILENCERESTREDLFYNIWTKKEAYLKAEGGKISDGLSNFSVIDKLNTIEDYSSCIVNNWYLSTVNLADGYLASWSVPYKKSWFRSQKASRLIHVHYTHSL